MSELKKQLKELAQLSLLANRISTIQEKNLKMFPFVYFDGVKEVVIDYDLGHGVDEKTKQVNHKSSVTYRLTMDGLSDNTNLSIRFNALEKSVRELFWKDVRIQVYFNGKLVYESKDV